MSESWDCPFCTRVATIGQENTTSGTLSFDDNNKEGTLWLTTKTVTCPNPACREYVISTRLNKRELKDNGTWGAGALLQSWQLRPQSNAKPFPDYIPAPLLADYTEACLVRDLSPKASATLSRRCLQGMIRDFWSVTERTLFEEISAIQNKVDPAIWSAMDAVRKIGNIGAHMERDINLVIDVDPDEAQTLIRLIEVLFQEWYVSRKQRDEHLAAIVAIAEAKRPPKGE